MSNDASSLCKVPCSTLPVKMTPSASRIDVVKGSFEEEITPSRRICKGQVAFELPF